MNSATPNSPDYPSSSGANLKSEATSSPRIVIVGGGHAGAQMCAGLHELGIAGATHLVCEEAVLPYHRPPLSKIFLKTEDASAQAHRAPAWYETAGVQVHLADPVERIDRTNKLTHLKSGLSLPYDYLVLATGTRARALTNLPSGLSNVFSLRTLSDAQALRTKLHQAERVMVLGGGFIGLEVAATAKALGKEVMVVEVASRLMGRSVSAELAEYVLATHLAAGIAIKLKAQLGQFYLGHTKDGSAHLEAVEVDGQREPVDLLLVGIGAEPEQALALRSDLECSNGIVVDANLRTNDPAIFAIGDCCSFAMPGGSRVRLESVQNANDQARAVARVIAAEGKGATGDSTVAPHSMAYQALPWFWSEQGSMRLQMAGLLPSDATSYRRAGATDASFSILHYRGETLMCVESVNAAQDHLASRKLLEAGISPPPNAASDPAVTLKSFI